MRPENLAIDATTSPLVKGLPAGMAALGTYYQHWLTIPVVDQFGDALGSSYDGAAVTENHIPINQKISRGTYKDSVGRLRNVATALAGGASAEQAAANAGAALGAPIGDFSCGTQGSA